MSSGNVTPLRRCHRCGQAANSVTLDLRGVVVSVNACRGCVEAVRAEIARLRHVFDAMLAAGVPRGIANQTMTFMLDRMDEEANRC